MAEPMDSHQKGIQNHPMIFKPGRSFFYNVQKVIQEESVRTNAAPMRAQPRSSKSLGGCTWDSFAETHLTVFVPITSTFRCKWSQRRGQDCQVCIYFSFVLVKKKPEQRKALFWSNKNGKIRSFIFRALKCLRLRNCGKRYCADTTPQIGASQPRENCQTSGVKKQHMCSSHATCAGGKWLCTWKCFIV